MIFSEYVSALREVYRAEGTELGLLPGATASDLQALEGNVSQALASCWKAANGSETPVFARPGFFSGYRLLSLSEVQDGRSAMEKRAGTYGDYDQPEKRDQRIRPGWFEKGWVPFAEFGGGSLLLLEDHAPAKGGKEGQIIGFVHDPDEIVYVADSLEDLLRESIQCIAADPYEFGISTDHL